VILQHSLFLPTLGRTLHYIPIPAIFSLDALTGTSCPINSRPLRIFRGVFTGGDQGICPATVAVCNSTTHEHHAGPGGARIGGKLSPWFFHVRPLLKPSAKTTRTMNQERNGMSVAEPLWATKKEPSGRRPRLLGWHCRFCTFIEITRADAQARS